MEQTHPRHPHSPRGPSFLVRSRQDGEVVLKLSLQPENLARSENKLDIKLRQILPESREETRAVFCCLNESEGENICQIINEVADEEVAPFVEA